jgi:trehalose 6-phosphate synthase
MAGRALIVVSNRGPVAYGRDEDGARVVRRGGGGLATALRGLAARRDVTWIASAITEEDRAVAAERGGRAVEESLSGDASCRLRLVAHDPLVFRRFYDEVANGTLWFLHHYLWGLGRDPDLGPGFREAWRDGYEAANRAFAEAVLDELDAAPEADVWFHDYHLYLAPRIVRERRPSARLTHFVHVPWPQPDYWRVLPEEMRRAIHEGLCANDVVGFHTERWRRSFEAACAAATDARTRTIANPIGIDPAEFDALRESPAVLAEEARIAAVRPELLVVRVDRTEPSKNVVRGLRAFGLLLEQHPELRGRAGLLALLDPSRQGRPEYVAYLDAVEREARALNERFGDGVRAPVDLQVADNFPQAVAAYKQFDVLLVNPIFDGMNLVAKEAGLVNERGGVIVLSENAGACEELGAWALPVNPFDLQAQADALHAALTMPEGERRRRARAIADHVRAHDVLAWSEAQLAALDRVPGPGASTIPSP